MRRMLTAQLSKGWLRWRLSTAESRAAAAQRDRGFVSLQRIARRVFGNAEQRRVDEITDAPNIEWGSQYDLAQMSEECDRIVAFN